MSRVSLPACLLRTAEDDRNEAAAVCGLPHGSDGDAAYDADCEACNDALITIHEREAGVVCGVLRNRWNEIEHNSVSAAAYAMATAAETVVSEAYGYNRSQSGAMFESLRSVVRIALEGTGPWAAQRDRGA